MMTENEIRAFLFTEGAAPMVIDQVIKARRDRHRLEQVKAMAKDVDDGPLSREARFEAEKSEAMANALTWVLGIMKDSERWIR